MTQLIDFDFHGVVSLRLLDATDRDVKVVSRQLGVEPTASNNQPDVTIRFCDSLRTSDLTYLGLHSAAFDAKGFYLMPSNRVGGKVKIPFQDVGGVCEIVCERGIRSVPMLNLILNVTFIAKGHIPVHGSAFTFEDTGVLVLAWATGGKTEALLAFGEHGAHYVGDEWVILGPDGRMFGIPTRTSIKDWQFRQLSRLSPKVGLQRRLFIAGVRATDRLNMLMTKSGLGSSFVGRALSQGLPHLRKEMKVWVMPKDFFGSQFREQPVTVDRVFLIMMHEGTDVAVEPIDPLTVVERMLASHEVEYGSLIRNYNAFRFAFPNLRNELLDDLREVQRGLLERALSDRPTLAVTRPYPVSLRELYDKLAEACR